MSSLLAHWTRLMPPTLTPTAVDADLRRHGLDPREVRGLISTLNQDLGVAFATGVLAGVRLGLACGQRRLRPSRRSNQGSRRVIPFPGPRSVAPLGRPRIVPEDSTRLQIRPGFRARLRGSHTLTM
jgi:hypothetical protein